MDGPPVGKFQCVVAAVVVVLDEAGVAYRRKNLALHDARLAGLEAHECGGHLGADARKGVFPNRKQNDRLQLQATYLVHRCLARRSGEAGWRKSGGLAKDLVCRRQSLSQNEAHLGDLVARDDEGLRALQGKLLAVDAAGVFENLLGQKRGPASCGLARRLAGKLDSRQNARNKVL